jgi:hypothetical protein
VPEENRMSDGNDTLRRLAEQFLSGQLHSDDFRSSIAGHGSEQLEHATLDSEREARCGFPEVVFATQKPLPALLEIVDQFLSENRPLLVTRVSGEQAEALLLRFTSLRFNELASTMRSDKTCRCLWGDEEKVRVNVAVVAAGSSDLRVAEEACETLAWMGVPYRRIIDVGVAGPQRLPIHLPLLRQADAVVVCAGMEGALPSVVAGHLACPIFAVPTSVGYGMSLGGVAALLSMLNSCAANVAVCNIDAGFKGGYLAGLVACRIAKARRGT